MNLVHNNKDLLDGLPAHIRGRIHLTIIGCWVYNGHPSSNGYMRLWHNGKRYMAHKWMLARSGKVVRTNQVDHLCENIKCCNPAHLESVPHLVNQRRKHNRRKFPWKRAGNIENLESF